MKILKTGAVALTVLGAATMLATPSQAGCRWCGPAAAGFVAGAATGAIVSNSYYGGYGYYGPGYAYAPGYAYGPGYAYYGGPSYYDGYDSYAYAPGPSYRTTYSYGRSYSTRSSDSGVFDR